MSKLTKDQSARVMALVKTPEIRSIQPLGARAKFAKAIVLEDDAGKTTPEALELLDIAIEFETAHLEKVGQ